MKLNAITSPYAGKKLKASHLKLLAKLDSFGLQAGDVPQNRSNPYRGVSIICDPLAVALVDFIQDSYTAYCRGGKFIYQGHAFPVSVWDNTRYLVLHLWPDVYNTLID